jgi:hypothetical protein
MKNYVLILISLFNIITFGDPQTFTLKPKKKQPKITVQDCCDQIFLAREMDAHILQYTGIIQSRELAWGRGSLEDAADAFFKKLDQAQLQDYYNHKKKCNVIREEYEKALREERDYLVQLEKNVMKNKN